MISRLRLAFQLGWGTLRSRPTLTLLAVLLLAFGTAIVGAFGGTAYLLRSFQGQFLTALSVELELAADNETSRASVIQRAEAWPSAEFVQYISPDQTLQEVEHETGENLGKLFGANPFPALVRVRFGKISLRGLDSLTALARQWPEVSDVVYPRRLWADFDRLVSRLTGDIGLAALGATVLMLLLVGLCLRAQVRNRAATWEFLQLSGMSLGMIRLALLWQETLAGVMGGLGAAVLLYALTRFYSWLLLCPVAFPPAFYLLLIIASILLAFLAGLLSPPRKVRLQ
jgi:cell division protein FtsX